MPDLFSAAQQGRTPIAPPPQEPDDIVEKCLWRAGLAPNTLKVHFLPECAKMIELLLQGGTTRQVGRICGVPHGNVMSTLRDAGAEPEWVPGQPRNEVMAAIYLPSRVRSSLLFPDRGDQESLGIGEPDSRVLLRVPPEVIEHAKRGSGLFWRTEALADREKRNRIEDNAVNAARVYYERHGYEVVSVEQCNKGWDLECMKSGNVELRVEVKGTESDHIRVELTPNEYKKSGMDSYRLAVVRNALKSNPKCAIYKKDGEENWRRPDSEGGDDRDAPDSLVTERVDAAVVRKRDSNE